VFCFGEEIVVCVVVGWRGGEGVENIIHSCSAHPHFWFRQEAVHGDDRGGSVGKNFSHFGPIANYFPLSSFYASRHFY